VTAPDARGASQHDVIVMGGGLAGLTLALQLKKRFAGIDVLVVERRSHPVPIATHKVGESSVEIGAHYFDTVLGLKEHLQQAQLRKFGFRFFFSEGRRDIDQVTELGASHVLPVQSYQIDRGIFENYLAEEAQRQGVRFVDHAIIKEMHLAEGAEPHRIAWLREGEAGSASARWLVDACGRAGMIKRRLGLAQSNEHHCDAVWFRIKDRIVIDDWTDNAEWRARCTPPERWRSTNHLVGAGYWVWLIPLASGSHSIGIVADPSIHPMDTYNSFDKAMAWFEKYQPRLFDELDGKRHLLQDFAFFKHFSYGCKQVFSADRWALTGEAGLFLDPFYSPGSDFIAISNTYICELIERDRAGQSLGAHAQIYDQVFHSFYESTLALYTGQYPMFADPEVLPVKVIWDYTYYWGVLSQFFFQNRLADLSLMSKLKDELAHCQKLNVAVQDFLRAWSLVSEKRNRAVMLDQAALPWFSELNRSLTDTLDDAEFRTRLQQSTQQLRGLARELLVRARGAHPGLDGGPLEALLDDLRCEMPTATAGNQTEPMLFAAAPA
jgi:flavin-dependent dehydrogenase